MSSDGYFTEKVRALIRERARGRCEMCGLRIPIGPQYHHRKPRRAGGTAAKDVSLPSNGVLLHPLCHEKIESNRAWALQRGWLLHAYDDPEVIPVRMWHGTMLLVGVQAVPTDQSPRQDPDGGDGQGAAGDGSLPDADSPTPI